MLSLLGLGVIELIVYGVLLGSVLALLFQTQKILAHHRQCDQQIGEVRTFLYEHVRNLESRLTHLQTVVQAQMDLKDVSGDSAERPICFNGGKLD